MDTMTIRVLLLAVVLVFVDCTNCPDFWTSFEGSCYLFADHHKSSFTEAENYCRQHHNSHLVHIDTEAENNFVKNILTSLKKETHWLGLTDEYIDGLFTWYDTDSSLAWSNWSPGQPDNAIGGNEDCVVFWADDGYQWHDAPCTYQYEPVCELRVAPTNSGTEIIGK